jgi:hypothetical protein
MTDILQCVTEIISYCDTHSKMCNPYGFFPRSVRKFKARKVTVPDCNNKGRSVRTLKAMHDVHIIS